MGRTDGLLNEVRSVGRTLRSNLWVAGAYCAYNAWLTFTMLGVATRCRPPEIPAQLALATLFACAAGAGLAVALWFRRTRAPLASPGHRTLTAALMTVSSCAFLSLELFGWPDGSPVHAIVFAGGCLAYAFGSSFFRIEIDRAFGWLGARRGLHVAMGGTIGMVVLLAPLALAPGPVWLAATVLLPLTATLCLRRGVADFPRGRYYGVDANLELPLPAQFCATSFVQGIANGVVYGGALGGMALVWDVIVHPASSLSWVVGVALALYATFQARLDYNRLIYKVGFPLMAGSLVAGVLCAAAPATHVAFLSAATCTDLVLWSLGAYIIRDMGMPAVWIASMPGAALSGGIALGAVLAWAVPAFTRIPALPLLAAWMLLQASLALFSDKNMGTGWGTFRIVSDGANDHTLDAALEFVRNEYELTPREADVVRCLARGLSRKETAEQLCVAEETIKTHLRGVYRKLDVHSAGEVAALVEGERRAMGAGERARTAGAGASKA